MSTFFNGGSYGTKIYGIEVTFNGMTSLLSFIKIYYLMQKLIRGQTRRQGGDLISLHFFIRKKSRPKSKQLGIDPCGTPC
jgi:hypothetical protein